MDDAALRGSFTLDSQPPLLIGGGSNLETSVSPSTLLASTRVECPEEQNFAIPEQDMSHAWYSVRASFHAAGHLSGVYLRFRYAKSIEHYRYLPG
jgi:hypothetical protein